MDPFFSASKYAVLGLGLSLNGTLQARGILLDVICPGAIDTPLTEPDIRAALKQEPSTFIPNSVAHLVTTEERGPIWMAFTERQGLQRYAKGDPD